MTASPVRYHWCAYPHGSLRETENTLILQDQIEQRTGIRVEILSNSEQRFLDYKSIASKGETFRRIIEEKTAILDIGGGSIQISLFDKDTLVSTQNLRLGVLRLQELLNHLNAGSTQGTAVVAFADIHCAGDNILRKIMLSPE